MKRNQLENKMKKEHYIYIDILNLFACISVIYMHCNGIVHSYENTRAWKESMIIETICYWAVPVFFMISGATLLDYRDKYSTKTYFEKRILKTVLPFIFWCIFNLGFKMLFLKMPFDWNISSVISIFNNAASENVYWFFMPLFAVYLSIPVISLLRKNKTVLSYMAVISFLVYSVYPSFCMLFKVTRNTDLIFPVSGGYLIYVILGYIFSKSELNTTIRLFIYFLGLIGVIVRYGTTVWMSVKQGSLYTGFWGYINFPAVFLAIAVFVAIKYIPWERFIKSAKLKHIIATLSGASFGVYLIHMIIYRILQSVTGIDSHSFIWRLIMPVIIYAVCVIIVTVMKKIPVVKYIVP